jgi:hypothetical protein
MSRGQRIGLLAAAVAIAVVAFVIAKPGSNDKSKDPQTTIRLQLKNHNLVGGSRVIRVKKDDRVLLIVSSDKPEKVHLHGYEIERDITPSKPGRFAFTAKNEGAYELESHTTEKKIATLQVQPR